MRVGLYVINLEGGLSIATLMTWPAFVNKEPMPHMVIFLTLSLTG